MTPFLGIKLGDSEQQLFAQMGKPDKTTQVRGVGVRLVEYEKRNYSFEVDRKKRVSSVRITNENYPHQPQGLPNIDEFRTALVQHNVNTLLQLLAGDVEFYKSGETYTFTRGARQELEAGTTDFDRLLYGKDNSVLTLFRDEKAEPDQQLRWYEKADPGSVAKFPDSKIVKEIVYKVEGGRWKVWEITLR
jgi:hypothetical protein